jgi:serine/threonine protein kinase
MKPREKLPPLERQFIETDLIRFGRFSSTNLAHHKFTGTEVELECYTYESPESPNANDAFQQFSNRKLLVNLVTMQRTLNVYRGHTYTTFVSERLVGTSPLDAAKLGPLPHAEVKHLFFLLAHTTHQVHSAGLAVCDWSPSNFLICGPLIKFTNYTTFRPLNLPRTENILSANRDVRCISPEMIDQGEFDPVLSDVWGLGLMLHLLLFGRRFIESSEDMWHQLRRADETINWDGIDDRAADLLHKLLAPNPQSRMSLTEVLAHRFLLPTMAFPIIHVPVELDPKVHAWLEFLGADCDDALDDAAAIAIREGSLFFHLAAAAVEKGLAPPGLGEAEKVEEEGMDLQFVSFPMELKALSQADAKRGTRKARKRDEVKSKQLKKLLAITRTRMDEAGVTLRLAALQD